MKDNNTETLTWSDRDDTYMDRLVAAMESMAPTERARRRAFIDITFQDGPPREVGVNGCHIEDVIDLLIERLRGFNEGPMRCRENSLAITALEEANNWLLLRRLNRVEQGVEGTYESHE